MNQGIGVYGALFCALSLAFSAHAQLKVDLTVKEPSGMARNAEWVTTGVPLPQGAVKDVRRLRIVSGSQTLPAQFKAQSPWPDGSVKWVLCTFPVSVAANGEAKVVLTDTGAAAPAGTLAVREQGDLIEVNTGAITAKINRKAFRLLDEVVRNGKTLLKQGTDDGALLFVTADRKLNAADLAPEAVAIEENGPRRVCVMAHGRFNGAMPKDGKEMIRWTSRIYFHEGSDQVRIHFTLGNDGAMGANLKQGREYFKFKGLQLDFGLALGANLRAMAGAAEGTPAAGQAFAIRQKGAYPNDGIFEALLGDAQLVTSADRRDEGWLALTGGEGGVSVAVREFWQNYPKELAATPGKLSVVLWPQWGGYPELQNIYNLCGGRQKTHEITLSFAGGGKDAAMALAQRVNKPLMALASADYYADCGALGLFSPAGVQTGNAELDSLIKSYDDLQRSKPAGLTQAAETRHNGGYYNWVNWGDLYWAAGSSSLHYDWTHVMLIHWLRTGQRDMFDWGYAMARHQHDIDLPRSDRDMPVYRYVSAYEKETSDRGQTGWHISTDKGSMIPHCSHHWIQGQCLYAVLTGDPEAWVSARLNGAEGVRSRLVNRGVAREGQARALGWGMECLLAVYAITGDKSCLDDARKIFKEGLWPMFTEKFKKTGDMGGNVQTSYIVRPLIDYHWHTGDPRVIEMLKAIVDKSDEWAGRLEYLMFGDAAAYVYYRTGEERFLTKARDVYLADALIKRRGKFNIRSGAWTKEQAKTSRSGYIHIAIERLKKLGKAPVK
jgi:hypothetical protein